MSNGKLTDKQRAQLYFDIASHYDEFKRLFPSMSFQEIYSELLKSVCCSLHSRTSTLSQLSDPNEKRKAYEVLRTFIKSSAEYTNNPSVQLNPEFNGQYHYRLYCNKATDHRFSWRVLNEFHRTDYSMSGYLSDPLSNINLRADESCTNSLNLATKILLYTLAVITGVMAFIAMYYLFSAILNNAERLFQNEGWLQASLSYFAMAACGVASAVVAITFASMPLASVTFKEFHYFQNKH